MGKLFGFGLFMLAMVAAMGQQQRQRKRQRQQQWLLRSTTTATSRSVVVRRRSLHVLQVHCYRLLTCMLQVRDTVPRGLETRSIGTQDFDLQVRLWRMRRCRHHQARQDYCSRLVFDSVTRQTNETSLFLSDVFYRCDLFFLPELLSHASYCKQLSCCLPANPASR